MLQKKLERTTLIFIGLLSIITGFLCILNANLFFRFVYHAIYFGFFIFSITSFIQAIFEKRKARRSTLLLDGVGRMIVAGLLYFRPLSILSMLPLAIGFYCLLNAIICIINYYVFHQDQIRGKTFFIVQAFLYFCFGIITITNPLYNSRYVLLIIGIYFIVYGLLALQDFYFSMYPTTTHKFKMTTPVLLSILIPQKLVLYINRLIETKGLDSKELKPLIPDNLSSDLKILIHLGDKGFDSIGHVDIEIDGIVISYGCHDHHNTKLGGALGPGIIHFDEKKRYLEFVTKIRGKSLVEFGVHLNAKEKSKIKNTLLDLAKRFEPWQTDQEKFENALPYLGDRKNYASLLTYYVRSKFFKFKSGKFRTYFIFSTNCVLLADSIVGKSGIDLLKINGFVTPGTYYEFLYSEFRIPNSKVVSRVIYTLHNVDELETNDTLTSEIYLMNDPIEFITTHIFKDC